MTDLQELLYNHGERLVPYVSHDESELIRHRSSYAFFHSVISADLSRQSERGDPISIADLGFGSGYGCALLSSLPDCIIEGVDNASECETYASQCYARHNVVYIIEDIATFVPRMKPYDYVVSRGVIEHVTGGLDLIKNIRFRKRVMIDVPYDEAPGNPHHLLLGIREAAFAHFDNCELFYEDLQGAIYDAAHRPEKANMIMMVLSAQGMPPASTLLNFPLLPVSGKELEAASLASAKGNRRYYKGRQEMLQAVEKAIQCTEVALDIGCGIAPMNYFRPKLHILVDPWKEYTDILSYRFRDDKSVIVLNAGALETITQFGENSVDSIFLLDVVEHLEKPEGLRIIMECQRVARQQIVIFTPLGFLDQHTLPSEADGWGLGGGDVQTHRSGWTPDDLPGDWTFYICDAFHTNDFKGRPLSPPHGAFFAVYNLPPSCVAAPASLSDYRRPLPSEREVEKLAAALDHNTKHIASQQKAHEEQLASLRRAYDGLLMSRTVRLTRFIRKIFKQSC